MYDTFVRVKEIFYESDLFYVISSTCSKTSTRYVKITKEKHRRTNELNEMRKLIPGYETYNCEDEFHKYSFIHLKLG